MSVENKDLVVEYAKTVEQLKSFIDRKEVEQKSFNATLSDTRENLNKVHAKLEALELKLNKPEFERRDYNPASEAKAAFIKFARGKEITPEERKSISVSQDQQGGYLVPEEMSKSIIEVMTEISPMRELSNVVTMSSDALLIPKRAANVAASWIAETATRSNDSTDLFAQVRIPAFEMYFRKAVSKQSLQDSAFNLEELLTRWGAEAFGYAENTAFVSGNAVNKPEGFLNNSGITTLNCGSTSTISADKLLDLTLKLKESDLNQSTWLFNRTVAAAIRELKSSTSNNYLWIDTVSNLTQGLPLTLCGRPFRLSPDMPDISSAAKVAAIGNWKQGYTIADRTDVSILVDPYTASSTGQTLYVYSKRVGGAVVDGSAIAALVMST